MKTLRINLCLLLILATQIFAQRFTAGAKDSIFTGFADASQSSGYFPNGKQIALLGEKNSSYANVMLVGGPSIVLGTGFYDRSYSYNVVNSYGNVFGTIYHITSTNLIKDSEGKSFYDNIVGAVLVLDSLNNNNKSAIVLFSSLTNLFIVQITINDANKISYNIIKRINLPEFMWMAGGAAYQGENRRLALLGSSQSGIDKIYHIAIGNPNSKIGANAKSGRVDFFSLIEKTWTFSQPNIQGLASGINGLFFGDNARFGTDLIPIMDKNGNNALAVLLPRTAQQHPQSAIYIFSMDNEWTPSAKPPAVITENSNLWAEEPYQQQDCAGLSIANWEKPHLLVSCNFSISIGSINDVGIKIKDIILDSNWEISSSYTFFSQTEPKGYATSYATQANPLPIKNHKNGSHAVSIVTNGPSTFNSKGSILVFPVMDVDYSKNYSIEAGKREIIVNADSLFYKSGTLGFSAKTLFGLVQCEIKGDNFLCEGEENAIGSWSALELSSKSSCDPYRECKRKDTIFVYVRSQKESPNTALKIPKDIVIPFFEQKKFNDLESLSHFKNPNLQNTKINWDASSLKLSAATSNKPNELSIVSLSQKEGTDTIIFNLSISSNTSNYPVRIHTIDSSKILNKGIPEKPSDSDTIWNTAQKRYIALPHSNSNGDIYTYDIVQDNLSNYVEITDNYLHILKIDVADIFIAYTENSQMKHRKITLMPEKAPLPNSNSDSLNQNGKEIEFATPIATGSWTQNLKATHINGGLQISGLNGEFEIKTYNFKGVEIQRERAYAQGSIFVKLKQNCPQVVQIKSGNQKIYIRIAN
jgi:hypothetical protein